MYGCMYGMSWFGHITMMLLWIGIVVGIIFLIRWLFVSRQSRREGSGSADLPFDILKERYARGEIDKDEFEVKKKDLLA
ncbi:MAG: SHOCT domain-containing protein [Deltaproteobacteria bacterium]|nr:SHOCT domain-containing protein [Deltaproteobacteria bacterium]